MTKKDFELIAHVIATAETMVGCDCCGILIEKFARTLAQTNPQFDREKFLKACGAT